MAAGFWSLPGLKHFRQSDFLNAMLRRGHGTHWGSFPSRHAAIEFLKDRRVANYDNDAVVQVQVTSFREVHSFDWPVLFFISKLMHQGSIEFLTDFGGHIGVKFYAYKDLLAYPPNFRWQVVDVPAVCREGVRQRSPTDLALSFHEQLEDTNPCELLLCSGSLQYADLTIDEIVARLPKSPDWIIINKVPVAEPPGFYTLESFGGDNGRMPARVFFDAQLNAWREKLGYELYERWDIPHRRYTVPFWGGKHSVLLIGEAWRKSA